jgi:hypothetical protein
MITATVEFERGQVEALQRRMAAMQDYTGRSARAVVFATTKDFLFAALAATPTAVPGIDRHGTDRKGKAGVWARIRRAHGRARATMEPETITVGGKARKLKRRRRVTGMAGYIEPLPKMTMVPWATAKKWGMRRQAKAGKRLDLSNEFGATFAQWKSAGVEKNYGKGFAKAGWIGALRTLGVGTGKGCTPMAVGFSDVANMLSAPVPAVSVANQVPYIEELDRGGPRRPPANIMAQALTATLARMDATLERLAAGFEAKWLGGHAREVAA